MLSNTVKRIAARSLLAAWGAMLASPLGVMAQNAIPPGPQLYLKSTGNVDIWDVKQKKWVHFDEDVAHVNDTFRAIEGGSLDCKIIGEGPSTEKTNLDKIVLRSCSAIRFVKLDLKPTGNVIYGKAFGMIDTIITHDRWALDTIQLEFPIGLATYGSAVKPPPTGVDVGKTISQTPNAADLRIAATNNSTSNQLQPITFVKGTIVSLNPPNGTFVIKEDNGKLDTVTCRYWTQVARKTLNQRVADETPQQMVASLQVGQPITVYGVATQSAVGEVPFGSGAFAQAGPINYMSTVIFPPGGQYIFGAVYVLSSPTVPTIGPGGSTVGDNTLENQVGSFNPGVLSGTQLKNMVCEIGNEAFLVPPLPPPAVIGAGAIGNTAIYALIGAGIAGVILSHSGGGGGTTPVLPNASR